MRNLAKSLFVGVYVLGNVVAFVHAILSLVAGISLLWLGPLTSAGAIMGFFGYLMAQRAPRTSAHAPVLVGLTGTGGAIAAVGAMQMEVGLAATLPLLYAIGFGFVGTLLYVHWYSRLPGRDARAIEAGKMLPEIRLEDADGREVSSRDFVGSPTVFLFFRGNWCPLCMAQIREVAGRYRELEARGVTVALVSPQSHENTRKLAERFEVPFRYLVDRGGEAARVLGILHENGLPAGMQLLGYDSDTVLPTVVITDAEGGVVFAHQTDNYRIRPEPELFFEALDRHISPSQRSETASVTG